MNVNKSVLEYNPGLFERPFTKASVRYSCLSKSWCQMAVWFVFGGLCVGLFALFLSWLSTSVNWFASLYFVGGLGWVPALMCGLSHTYYKMFQKMDEYLAVEGNNLSGIYKETSTLIFGYLRGGTSNVCTSIAIWIAMLCTVILNEGAFNSETNATKMIYIVYLFVGLVFTCVPCAAFHFMRALKKLKGLKLNDGALYCGGVECVQTISRNCALLIWSIVVLLGLLAFAMLKSPYQEALWVWLPPFGAVPLILFIQNYQFKKALISTALHQKEQVLQGEIRNILAKTPKDEKLQSIHNINNLLGFQERLRTYCHGKPTIASTALLITTILGSLGSLVAALVPFKEFIEHIFN